MNMFLCNKNNKNDIVNTSFFGHIPLWVACIADWVMLSVILVFLTMQYMIGGWGDFLAGFIALVIGYSLAKWVF